MLSKEPFFTRLSDWLERVGKSRDGILVIGGALYILGYAVWSVNAYIKGLGLLPAFESQYFIAGTVPFLIFFLVYRLIRFSWARQAKIPWWLNIWETRKWWKNIVALLPGVVAVGSAILGKGSAAKYFAGRGTLIGGIVASIAGLLVILAIFSIDFSSPDPLKLRAAATETKWKQRILVGVRLLIIVAAGVVALYFYIGLIYSKLPQSLGGVRPRCAHLDVQETGVSKDTLRAILPPDVALPTEAHRTPPLTNANTTTVTATAEREIIRSDKLEVLFSGGDYLLIRSHGEIFEIKRDVIHSVRSCD